MKESVLLINVYLANSTEFCRKLSSMILKIGPIVPAADVNPNMID
jgi:hypothetical protein